MNINFTSSVVIVSDIEAMKQFYIEVLQQQTVLDFGNCINFKNGLTIWKLKQEYPIAQKLGRTFDNIGNRNLELCFETENFDSIVEKLKNHNVSFLHEEEEEAWGQRTVRFYDPENNLIEVGESIPCFVKRLYNNGMTIDEVSNKTSVPLDLVKQHLNA